MMKEAMSDYETYLYLSFLPRFSEANLQWLNCDLNNDFGKGVEDEAWWVNEGVKAFKETIINELTSTDVNVTHILPLSGGLDSRAILGGLLENLPKSQIIAATYGIPGAWDLEIAKNITRKLGIRHEVFDLTSEKWDIDRLLAAATRLKYPVSVYQSYVRQKINNYFGATCTYWSGFMGDALDWIEIKTPNTDKRKAIDFLLQPLITRNYKDQNFMDKIVNRMMVECQWGSFAQSKFTLDLQLQISIQQQQLTGPIVLINGFSFKTPFLNKRWIGFSSNIPYKWLVDRRLYKKIIHAGYRELAKFPTTASAGMPVRASRIAIYIGKAIAKIQPYIIRRDPYFSQPRINYINWTESLRHKGSLQDTVYTTLLDLKKRAIFNNDDINTWWRDHLERKADYTTLLMNLSSLEILLKAGVMI